MNQKNADVEELFEIALVLYSNLDWMPRCTEDCIPYMTICTYRVAQKIGTIILYALTLLNINCFQNYFTLRIRRLIA